VNFQAAVTGKKVAELSVGVAISDMKYTLLSMLNYLENVDGHYKGMKPLFYVFALHVLVTFMY
jgi:hypothetical protein